MINAAYKAYSQSHTSIETPEKLVEMLYEGVLKFTSLAKRAIVNNDYEAKTKWINRSTSIFTELINTLNYDGGDMAHYLSGLYSHQIRLLTQANIEDSTKELDTVINVTKTLLETWKEEAACEVA